MAKTTDFPPALRHFVKILSQFGYRYHDYELFRDFVDYAVACFLFRGEPATAERLKNRYGDDYHVFSALLRALVDTMQEQLQLAGWYDALGDLYMEIASRSHASGLGQFFTPPAICDLLASSQIEPGISGKTVCDPACGSGRNLLAANAVALGNYHVAQDIDPVCSKMAAINMALHGLRGQVQNGDTLAMTYRFGYLVNPWPTMMGGIPHLLPATAAELRRDLDRWTDAQTIRPVIPEAEPDNIPDIEPDKTLMLPEIKPDIILDKNNQIRLAL